jgi:uncharacterized protein
MTKAVSEIEGARAMRSRLLKLAEPYYEQYTADHDFLHVQRVLANGEALQAVEGGNLLVIQAATIGHDIISRKKNNQRASNAATDSAQEWTKKISKKITDFPNELLSAVYDAIKNHSWSHGQTKGLSLEAQIVQDADRLDNLGAVAIFRTASVGATLNRMFNHPTDPFFIHREPEPFIYTVDAILERPLKVFNRLNTETARKMAKPHVELLYLFLADFATQIGHDLPKHLVREMEAIQQSKQEHSGGVSRHAAHKRAHYMPDLFNPSLIRKVGGNRCHSPMMDNGVSVRE